MSSVEEQNKLNDFMKDGWSYYEKCDCDDGGSDGSGGVYSWNALMDKPFGLRTTKTLAELQMATGNETILSLTNPATGDVGDVMYVTFDGVEYETTVYILRETEVNTLYAVGNGYIRPQPDFEQNYIGTDTMPFLVVFFLNDDKHRLYCYTQNPDVVHTIGVSVPSDPYIATIDAKYIPDISWKKLTDKPFGVVTNYLQKNVTEHEVSASTTSGTVKVSGLGVLTEDRRRHIHEHNAVNLYLNDVLYKSGMVKQLDDGYKIFTSDGEEMSNYLRLDRKTGVYEASVTIPPLEEDTTVTITYEYDAEFTTIDPKFLPDIETSWNDLEDKPFWESEPSEVVLFDEPNYNETELSDTLRSPFGLIIPGETYTVVFDDVEYKDLTAETAYGDTYIGDIDNMSDELPFFIVTFEDAYLGTGLYITSTSPETTHSIQIKQVKSDVHKIEDKYLVQSDWKENDRKSAAYIANRPFYEYYTDEFIDVYDSSTDGVVTEIVTEGEFVPVAQTDDNGFTTYQLNSQPNVIYYSYTTGTDSWIEFDGVMYQAYAEYGSGVGNAHLSDPSAADTGEPFYMIRGYATGDRSWLNIWVADTNAHTIKFIKRVTSYVKIPAEFIPDDVLVVDTWETTQFEDEFGVPYYYGTITYDDGTQRPILRVDKKTDVFGDSIRVVNFDFQNTISFTGGKCSKTFNELKTNFSSNYIVQYGRYNDYRRAYRWQKAGSHAIVFYFIDVIDGVFKHVVVTLNSDNTVTAEVKNLIDVPTDDHINSLINNALGVIENGSY